MDKQMDFQWLRVTVKQRSLYVKYNVFYSEMYLKVSFGKGIVELQCVCLCVCVCVYSFIVDLL